MPRSSTAPSLPKERCAIPSSRAYGRICDGRFRHFWQWANKPTHSRLTIPADLHHAVTSLPPVTRRDRARVNEAVRKILEGTGHQYAKKSIPWAAGLD
jgi:hypothetical protein